MVPYVLLAVGALLPTTLAVVSLLRILDWGERRKTPARPPLSGGPVHREPPSIHPYEHEEGRADA